MLGHTAGGTLSVLGELIGRSGCEILTMASDRLSALCAEEEEGILVEILDCFEKGESLCSGQTNTPNAATLARTVIGCLMLVGIEDEAEPVRED